MTVVSITPARNEAGNIAAVSEGILKFVDHAVVVDNASSDGTGDIARAAGADVVVNDRIGYGAACLAGVARARELGATTLVFLDGDGSEDPEDAPLLLDALNRDGADLVLGVRTRASTEPGAMTRTQRFGNWLAPVLMELTVGARYVDMPPFKAIRMAAFDRLQLSDTGHGFTIEMLMRAHRVGLTVSEVVVRCRRRAHGESKVSGHPLNAARASVKIISVIGKYALSEATLRPR